MASSVCSSYLHASFGTFWVQNRQLVEAKCVFKHSEDFEIVAFFLRKRVFVNFEAFFKDSLTLEYLTNLDLKCAKKKREDVGYKLLSEDFQNSYVVNELQAVKFPLHAYGVR